MTALSKLLDSYPLQLFQREITASLKTLNIVKALPALDI